MGERSPLDGARVPRSRTEKELIVEGPYRTTRDLRNGWGTIPAGTIVEVDRKFGGVTLVASPCPCCGLRASISRVGFDAIVYHRPEAQ